MSDRSEYILIADSFLDEFPFDAPKNIDIRGLLLEIYLSADKETNVLRILPNRLTEKYKTTITKIDKMLCKLQEGGFIEVYKGYTPVRGLCYLHIALRHNEFIDFAGEETYLEMPHYTFKHGRNTPKYNEWRDKCLKRDDYTCQKCRSKENLCVHHIKSYAEYPGLATTVSNGITLCQECHKEEHRRHDNG